MRVKKCRYAGPTPRVKNDFYDRLCGEKERIDRYRQE